MKTSPSSPLAVPTKVEIRQPIGKHKSLRLMPMGPGFRRASER